MKKKHAPTTATKTVAALVDDFENGSVLGKEQKGFGKKILSWVGMLFFIVVSFVLGNIVGNIFITQQYDIGSAFQRIGTSLRLDKVFKTASPSPQQTQIPSQPPTTTKIGGVEVKLPGPNSTKEEQDAFAKVIEANAKQVTTIEVKEGCVVSPEVVKTPENTTLTITNSDTKQEHTLSFGDTSQTVKLTAGGKETFVAKLKGVGIYGIVCDGKNLVGQLQIVAKN